MNFTCSMCFKGDSEQDSQKEARKKVDKISQKIDRQISIYKKMEVNCIKLLLLGTGESGKSTLLKQMKIIHINGFSNKERLDYIPIIKQNIRDVILSILGGMKALQLEFIQTRTADLAKNLIDNSLAEDYTYPDTFFDEVDEIWHDPGVQRAYTRSTEFHLFDSATYIVDVSGQRGERKKWIQFFDNVTAILYLVDCSGFDKTLLEDHRQNRLIDSLEVFEQAWNNKYLRKVPMIVFLNKIDLLEEKICNGHRIDHIHNLAEAWLQSAKCSRHKTFYVNRSKKNSSTQKISQLLKTDCNTPFERQSMTSNLIQCSKLFPSASIEYNQVNRKLSNTLGGDSSTTDPSLNNHHHNNNINDNDNDNNNNNTNNTWTDQPLINKRFSSTISLHSSFRLNNCPEYCCSVISIPCKQPSSGLSSRLSCTTLIARLVAESPYHNFKPTAQQRTEFLTCLLPTTKPLKYHLDNITSYRKKGNSTDIGVEDEISKIFPQQPKFIIKHPETVRTACYIRHLFEVCVRYTLLYDNSITLYCFDG
ncbi:guanine nucleotide-binding protein G(s) subunit alpha [Schistosoma bovis]|uniref:Adenylate cyclase-stimulating G alpha protein n=1 Tax=Schistosoma bovis TaxID=6184 RepID=A0A430QHT1_SCHBO|nr:guanine nucleotide-binding protein G(s) subunit alpha [Schistosoma bovis]